MNYGLQQQMGIALRTVNCDTILQDLQLRAETLRSEIAAIEGKRAELATLEKMIAAAKGTKDEPAGTHEVGSVSR